MDYDIIICAIIAVLVLARLWQVLGQRNGEERERGNPFSQPFSADSPQPGQAQNAPAAPKPPVFAPDSLAGGLAQIKEADPAFDEKQFLQNVRSAFTLVLGGYIKGDMGPCERFLTPQILAHFNQAIAARNSAGQVAEHNLLSIRDAECVTAKLDNGRATIMVRFISDQESVKDGKTEEVTDMWVFARDAKNSAADWILVETRS